MSGAPPSRRAGRCRAAAGLAPRAAPPEHSERPSFRSSRRKYDLKRRQGAQDRPSGGERSPHRLPVGEPRAHARRGLEPRLAREFGWHSRTATVKDLNATRRADGGDGGLHCKKTVVRAVPRPCGLPAGRSRAQAQAVRVRRCQCGQLPRFGRRWSSTSGFGRRWARGVGERSETRRIWRR